MGRRGGIIGLNRRIHPITHVYVSQGAFVPAPGLQSAMHAAVAPAAAPAAQSDSLGLSYFIRAYQVRAASVSLPTPAPLQ